MMLPVTVVWSEIRRRWRGAAAVGLVLGIGFAAVLVAAAGARRTETAFPRMLEATGGTHLVVSLGNEDQAVRHQFYDEVEALEGVDGVGRFAGIQLVPMHVPKGAGTQISSCALLSLDGVFGYGLDRPNVLEGRLPQPDRSDEIFVTDAYARSFGVRTGDRLDLVLAAGGSVPAAGEVTAADGPIIGTTIVGIGTLGTQIVPLSDLEAAPTILAPPGVARRHAPDQESWCYDASVLRLRPGGRIRPVMDEIDRMSEPLGGALVQDRVSNYAEVRRAIQPQVTALWLFAVVAALATVLVVAQLLGRQLQQVASAAAPVWGALGVTRFQVGALVAAPSVVTSLVGGSLALVGAVALSGRFPIGPARLAETSRGIELHASIHLGGAFLVVVAAMLIGAGAAFVATRQSERPARRGLLARIAAGSSQPSVLVGIHMATGASRGDAAVPVRSAAAGTALAVAAVAATVAFAGGLDDLVSRPERYGRDWDVMVDGVFAPAPVAQVLGRLREDPAVAAIAGGRYGEGTIGGTRVPTIGLSDLEGTTFPAIIDGRAPVGVDEIVVGTRSARDLRLSVGDTVPVDLGAGPREMTIVGTTAFPRLNHGAFSTLGLGIGAAVRTEALPPYDFSVSARPPDFDSGDYVAPSGAMFEFVTIKARRDAAPADRRRLVRISEEIIANRELLVRTEQRPIAIDNYAAVRSTPAALAVLLGSMAAATLAHLVVTVVRRRRRDLALLEALGMRRTQVLRAVVVHALVVANLALLVGLPLGLAAGQLAWRSFAADLGIVDELRLPFGALALIVPVVQLLAITIALVPAVAVGRARPALALRTE